MARPVTRGVEEGQRTATEDFPGRAAPNPALITQSVALVFAGFGLLASLAMGWMLARSTAGLPPFPVRGRRARCGWWPAT